jgi:hypothetical protein
VAWNSYGWAVVQVEPEPDEAGMSMPDSFTFAEISAPSAVFCTHQHSICLATLLTMTVERQNAHRIYYADVHSDARRS